MLFIEDKLVEEELLTARFCCNLAQCKGACCVEGDGGAPLEPGEVAWLAENLPALEAYLAPAGRQAIRNQGVALRGEDGGWETPLVAGRECAYAVVEETGIVKCAIENAWHNGVVNEPKPISCHLYPIRVRQQGGFPKLVYSQWHICAPARAQGSALGLPVYRFLRTPIVRAFGQAFYDALDAVARDRA
jgi:hypothetical protein